MIELHIPGCGTLNLHHLVMDVNGTLAIDGVLIDGIARRITTLRDRLDIHLITANTHGAQNAIDERLGLRAVHILPGNEAAQKANYVRSIGKDNTVAIGQGANDALMLKEAAIGICVMSIEGLNSETLLASNLLMPDILSALDLFDKPLRLIASLRK